MMSCLKISMINAGERLKSTDGSKIDPKSNNTKGSDIMNRCQRLTYQNKTHEKIKNMQHVK